MAKTDNIRQAADSIGISPSAISKAIARLESELEIKMIEKVGRNIQLTPAGQAFAKQGAELLALERQIVDSHKAVNTSSELKMVGPELPLSHWGPLIMSKVLSKFPQTRFNFEVTANDEGLEKVKSFEADLAIFSSPKQRENKMLKKIGDVHFKTFVAKDHFLGKKKRVSVKDVIEERFVLTNASALALFNDNSLGDGWRDDKFQRKNIVFTDSLKTLEVIIKEGLAISYLPDFYGRQLGLKELNLTDCPYTCSLSLYLSRHKYALDEVWEAI